MSTPMTWLVSVRGRITVVVTVVFGLAMVLGGWFLLGRAESAWISDLQAADLAELKVLGGRLELFAAQVELFAAQVGSLILPVGAGGTSFELIDDAGRLVAQTPRGVFGGPISLNQDQVSVLEAFRDVVGIPFGGEVTTVHHPVELSHGTLTLTASSSLEPVRAGVSALRGILLTIVPLLAGGVGVMTWFVTGRAFRPVKDITSQVERITDGRLDERVPVPSSRDEVAHLALTMNTMLERLSASRRRQREFVSDASHELRNPVATSRTKLEVALAHPNATDWEETASVVLEEQERLSGLVDDMLLLARIDEGRSRQHAEVDLDDIVFSEVSRLETIEVDVSAVEPVRICGDARQLVHLVRNLVDNAARHAKARVTLSLSSPGVLVVEDDGHGIPVELRTRVFERFVRLEDSRARDQGGDGLGLALVHAVVEAHGGTVTVGESSSGGARFEIHFPHKGGEKSTQKEATTQGDPEH